MHPSISLPDGSSSRELRLTRMIAAPAATVFHAWTHRLGEWWGPHGMTTPVVEMDLRPGGTFRTIMRAPDGTEYQARGVFLELTPPRRLVFTDAFEAGWQPQQDPFFTAVITFDEMEPQRTLVTARALHWSVENCDRHAKMGFEAGWGESLDRLAALLARP